MQNTDLQQKIMRRVYIAWAVRRITSPLALKLYAVAGLAGLGLAYISPANIIQNSAHLSTPAAYYRFFSQAFLNTEVMTQLLLVVLMVLAVLLARDIAKTLKIHLISNSPNSPNIISNA